MKKSDLKTGMVVESKNGSRFILTARHNNEAVLIRYHCIGKDTLLSDYDEDLLMVKKSGFDELYDIVRVYDLCDDFSLKLLWERKIIKLTKEERSLLEIAYNKGYKYIVRDENNPLYIFKGKPHREEYIWIDETGYWLEIFEDMCDFIKWEDEEPYSIEKLLKEN